MKSTAAQVHESGKPLQIEEITLPNIKSTEVLVKVHYAGINFYEIMLADGNYPSKAILPFTMGGELSGEVISVGSNVSEFKKGDRIFSMAQTAKGTTGSYATYANIDEQYVYHLPDFLSYEQGAAFPMIFFSAYNMLTKKVLVKDRMTILIHSGSGGVGGTLIQLIKILYPTATIMSTSSSIQKKKIIADIGADFVIQSNPETFVSEALTHIPNGFDIIFDPVGQELFESHIKLLKPLTGILCSYGTYSGAIQDPKAIGKLRAKNLTLAGFLMWSLLENKQWCNDLFEEILSIMNTHSILPRIDKIFPLHDVNNGFSYIKNRKNTGKILLKIIE